MVNWDFFKPRNLFVVAVFSVIGYMVYAYFTKASEAA